MYAIDKIVLLPSIQRIAESLNRLLGVTIGVISEGGDLCWLGVSPGDKENNRVTVIQTYAAKWFQTLSQNPAASTFWDGPDNTSGIAVPVFENARCSAMVFAAFFVLESSESSHFSCISRREARLALEMLMEISSEIRENAPVLHQRRESAEYSCNFSEIIGSSVPMKALLNELELICRNETPVLIQGAMGSGKQLIARTIHLNSMRKSRPFMDIDCASMPENQLESELFGHKRGAFNGAMSDQPGMFDVANGGTFFLNEIQALSPSLQYKLLKLIECGSFLPLGDTVPHSANIRIIAASSEDIQALCEQGRFRQDLFYRLSIMNIRIPTLAERREDIPELVDYDLSKFCQIRQIPVKTMHPDAVRILMNYDWPGNLLEFENEIERLITLTAFDDVILPEFINPRIARAQFVKADTLEAISDLNHAEDLSHNFTLLPGQTLQDALDEIERRIIGLTLKKNEGNRTKAAEILGISRRNLIRKIESLHVDE